MTKIYEWYDKLDFGDYKGVPLADVFQKDPDYVVWCMEQKDGFSITINTCKYLEDLRKGFEFPLKARKAIINQKKYSCRPGESEFRLFPSGDPFIQPMDDNFS